MTGNAQAFGFSITITVTYGVVSASQASPSQLELVGFGLSAVAAFSLLNITVSRLLGRSLPGTGTRAMLVGTATDFLAVGAAIAAAIGVSDGVDGWGAWMLAPFCTGIVYVLVQALELTGGESEEDDEGSV